MADVTKSPLTAVEHAVTKLFECWMWGFTTTRDPGWRLLDWKCTECGRPATWCWGDFEGPDDLRCDKHRFEGMNPCGPQAKGQADGE